jgi:hypothetical protein
MHARLSMMVVVVAVAFATLPARAGEPARNLKKSEMPEAVARAVKENKPGAEIGTLTMENESGINLYDIEFKAGQGEIEVAEDGTVMDVATIVQMKDLPKAAADAITKAAAGATVKHLEKSEVRAEIEAQGDKGRVTKLPAAKYVYEAELAKDGKTGEVQVDPEGKIVEGPKWGKSEETAR